MRRCCDKIYDKICSRAEKLVQTGCEIESEFGIPIVNKRISVTPMAIAGAACKSEDFVPLALTLDRAAKTCGVNFIGGYSALVQKGFAPGDLALIRSIPQALAVGEQIHSYEPIRTGDPRIDSLADELLKQIPTDGKTDAQKIQAVYDWIIRNCVRDGWDGTTWFDEAQVSAAADALARDPNYQAQILRPEFKAERTPGDLPGMYLYDYDSNAYIAAFAYEMMYKRCGNCAHFAALLTVLLTRLGYDCRLIDGVFVNNDGSTYEHKWNYVLVDGQYYWLDVRMDHAGYARTGSISHSYFLKSDTAAWARSHQWEQSYLSLIHI